MLLFFGILEVSRCVFSIPSADHGPGFRARNSAPAVYGEVATPVSPTCSTSTNPASRSTVRRSPTGIAPPIQSDQASRPPAGCGAASSSTMSANCNRPPGRRTRWISWNARSFRGDRFSTPFEVTTHFDGGSDVRVVVVHDSAGRHEVPVRILGDK